jgi:hypothetical protein
MAKRKRLRDCFSGAQSSGSSLAQAGGFDTGNHGIDDSFMDIEPIAADEYAGVGSGIRGYFRTQNEDRSPKTVSLNRCPVA